MFASMASRFVIRIRATTCAVAMAACLPLAAGGTSASAAELKVGLYPYVPRLEQFKDVLTAAWDALGTGYTLNYATVEEWDGGYDVTSPGDLDVYVFDAIYYQDYLDNNQLEPLTETEVENLNDFLPYSLDPLLIGDKYYGIPLLGCGNILFYDQGDPLDDVDTFD